MSMIVVKIFYILQGKILNYEILLWQQELFLFSCHKSFTCIVVVPFGGMVPELTVTLVNCVQVYIYSCTAIPIRCPNDTHQQTASWQSPCAFRQVSTYRRQSWILGERLHGPGGGGTFMILQITESTKILDISVTKSMGTPNMRVDHIEPDSGKLRLQACPQDPRLCTCYSALINGSSSRPCK